MSILTSIRAPTQYLSSVVRASFECCTSMKGIVASRPAFSNMTSSPPGC